MEHINIHQAKTHLSAYLERISKTQETLILCKNGHPIAELRPYHAKKKLAFGCLKGKIRIADDFDTLPDDFMDYFK